jgi:DNA/RNA endonuclease YhcR with UshA esterase domain
MRPEVMHCSCSLFSFRSTLLALVVLSSSFVSAADCVSFAEARHYIGKSQCISGTIFHVKDGRNGVTFLDFCEDYEVCPFTVVVFANDLRKMGDVKQLKGRSIQINGKVEEYDGRAEIILRNPQQLGEAASLLPPLSQDAALAPTLPADYDVERRGHYSAGKFKRPKKAKATATNKQGAPTSMEDPSQQ